MEVTWANGLKGSLRTSNTSGAGLRGVIMAWDVLPGSDKRLFSNDSS